MFFPSADCFEPLCQGLWASGPAGGSIGDAIEKITHTGAHAADAKVEPGAPASGSPKVVEGEVVKPPPS